MGGGGEMRKFENRWPKSLLSPDTTVVKQPVNVAPIYFILDASGIDFFPTPRDLSSENKIILP